MADIFLPDDVTNFLAGKNVLFLGDSLMRGLYKDLVWLISSPTLIPREILGAKGESNFPDFNNCKTTEVTREIKETFHPNNRDQLLDYKGLTSGRSYIEPRKYSNKKYNINITYKFMSRVFPEKNKSNQEDLTDWFNSYENDKIDIIIMSSCLWDINRWGPDGPDTFKEKLPKLLDLISRTLPDSGQFLWLTNPPGAPEINSRGMNIPGLSFLHFTTRYSVIEANNYAAEAVAKNGFGVLDLHWYLQMQAGHRNRDGIHWSPETNRLVTNLILTHLCLSSSVKLPGRVPPNNLALQLAKLRAKTNNGKELKEAIEKGGQSFYQKVNKGKASNDGNHQAAKRRCLQIEQTKKSQSNIRCYVNGNMHDNSLNSSDTIDDNCSPFNTGINHVSWSMRNNSGAYMRGTNPRRVSGEDGMNNSNMNQSPMERNMTFRQLQLVEHRENIHGRELTDFEMKQIQQQVYDECEEGQTQVPSPSNINFPSWTVSANQNFQFQQALLSQDAMAMGNGSFGQFSGLQYGSGFVDLYMSKERALKRQWQRWS